MATWLDLPRFGEGFSQEMYPITSEKLQIQILMWKVSDLNKSNKNARQELLVADRERESTKAGWQAYNPEQLKISINIIWILLHCCL